MVICRERSSLVASSICYEAVSMRVRTATRENLTAAKCHINCENCVSGSFVKELMVNSLWRIATLTFLGIPFMLSEMTIDKWLRLCMFDHLSFICNIYTSTSYVVNAKYLADKNSS